MKSGDIVLWLKGLSNVTSRRASDLFYLIYRQPIICETMVTILTVVPRIRQNVKT